LALAALALIASPVSTSTADVFEVIDDDRVVVVYD
jgi:hypothetical protein